MKNSAACRETAFPDSEPVILNTTFSPHHAPSFESAYTFQSKPLGTADVARVRQHRLDIDPSDGIDKTGLHIEFRQCRQCPDNAKRRPLCQHN